jgi:GAF domain-containing protein
MHTESFIGAYDKVKREKFVLNAIPSTRQKKIIAELSYLALMFTELRGFFQDCMQTLGACLKTSGCYIWQYDPIHCQLSMLSEWSVPGVPSICEYIPKILMNDRGEWIQAIDRACILKIKEDINPFSPQVNALLNTLSLKKLLLVPLYFDGGLYGLIGLSAFKEDQDFMTEDILILEAATNIISKAIESNQLQKFYRENV